MSEFQNDLVQHEAGEPRPRAKERYIEISGPDKYGRAKTHIIFSQCIRYGDGTSKVLQEFTVSLKPIVSVFQQAGFVNVDLDFRYRDDVDLAMIWNLLQEHKRPENSVDWTPDELESGYYKDADGNQHMIYFPVIEMTMSLKGKETEFALTGINPLPNFTLSPNTVKGEVCVLQLTFLEDWFFVTELESDSIDLSDIHKEAMSELDQELTQ